VEEPEKRRRVYLPTKKIKMVKRGSGGETGEGEKNLSILTALLGEEQGPGRVCVIRKRMRPGNNGPRRRKNRETEKQPKSYRSKGGNRSHQQEVQQLGG